PATLGAAIKSVMDMVPGVAIEASTSRTSTTFLFRGKSEGSIEKARKLLLSRISRKISISLPIPSSTRSVIIGAKGRTLKAICEETGAQIQIPPRDDAAEQSVEPDADPLVDITISGDATAVQAAKARVEAIVGERTSKTTVRLTDIEPGLIPLLNGARGAAMDALIQVALEPLPEVLPDAVNVHVPSFAPPRRDVGAAEEEPSLNGHTRKETAIVISGLKEAVAAVEDAIRSKASELARTVRSMTVQLPKRQHRLLIGANAEAILETTRCTVEVPAIEDPSENVTVRGLQTDFVNGLSAVMEKANSAQIDTIDLATVHRLSAGQSGYPAQLQRYLSRRSKLRALQEEYGAQIYLPRPGDDKSLVEIVGKDAKIVAAARSAVLALLKTLPPPAFSVAKIDPLLHRHLIGKQGLRLTAFEQKKGVEVLFPSERDAGDQSEVLLVLSNVNAASSTTTLEDVKTELLKLAKEQAEIKTVTIEIPVQLHGQVIGPSGTTLNAVIGEQRLVSPSDEVARVQKALSKIADDAQANEIENAHTTEFEVDAKHVGRLVGKGGSNVQELRDQLGVKIDFEEQAPATDGTAAARKRKAKSKVTIKGRAENVAEARKRMLSHSERLADETFLAMPLPTGIDRGSLIGKQGVYLQRLEQKYEVRINIPNKDTANDDDASSVRSTTEEITIRGPKKGAEAAKKELLDLISYERENSQSDTVQIHSAAIPRLLGKGGSQINQIKADTLASIDVPRDDREGIVSITLRGTAEAIVAARRAVLAITGQAASYATLELDVARKHHNSLIGKGGRRISEIVSSCGGPSDKRSVAALVTFPRVDDDSSIVKLQGDKTLISKIRAVLEKEAADLDSRIITVVAIPSSSHSSIVGRGGSNLSALQLEHNVRIILPGWQEYADAQPISNATQLGNASSEDLIKVIGTPEACAAAAEALESNGKRQGPATNGTHMPTSAQVIGFVHVPAHLHHRVADQGRFFRKLPRGVKVDHKDEAGDAIKLPPRMSAAASSSEARIDVNDDESFGIASWIVTDLGSGVSTIPWRIIANSDQLADQAKSLIEEASADAGKTTHQARLVVQPQNLVGRLIGKGGSGLEALRQLGVSAETVGQNSNVFLLTGSQTDLEKARSHIEQVFASRR
ncbi:uncharacterized protein L969DRAFT_49218, partial [Mixia osmundae IAM 14324]|uniref:uncharacterized protein n=1 Tax=Mixia osmundae (strain CBS 9802 / IAM 14324 / JCM 22182 / KY 12970) TaxID=764103 RepID=UPI0004A5477E